jgi:hypothetical protein
MFGWLIAAAARASRSKRSTAARSRVTSSERNVSATLLGEIARAHGSDQCGGEFYPQCSGGRMLNEAQQLAANGGSSQRAFPASYLLRDRAIGIAADCKWMDIGSGETRPIGRGLRRSKSSLEVLDRLPHRKGAAQECRLFFTTGNGSLRSAVKGARVQTFRCGARTLPPFPPHAGERADRQGHEHPGRGGHLGGHGRHHRAAPCQVDTRAADASGRGPTESAWPEFGTDRRTGKQVLSYEWVRVVARDGIEPPTPAFSGLRSTD